MSRKRTHLPPDDSHFTSGLPEGFAHGPFARMVAWATHIFHANEMPSAVAVVKLANAIEQSINLPQQSGGFEFHHDGSNQVDFLVLCNTHHTLFGDLVQRPSWFDALVSATRDVQENPAESTADSSTEAVANTPVEIADMFLPSRHWLEFDQADTGVMLAGVWQAITLPTDRSLVPTSSHDAQVWLDQLADVMRVTSVDASRLGASQCMKHFATTIGMPTQFGVMCGRGDFVKIFRCRTKTTAEQFEAFFSWPSLSQCVAKLNGITPKQLGQVLANDLDDVGVGPNVDVDLRQDTFPQGFGIEFHGVTTSPGVVNEKVVRVMRDVLCVDGAAIERMLGVCARLPQGVYQDCFVGMEDFLHPNLRREAFTACVNHVKVVIRPDRPPTVKTYVLTSLHRGAVT